MFGHFPNRILQGTFIEEQTAIPTTPASRLLEQARYGMRLYNNSIHKENTQSALAQRYSPPARMQTQNSPQRAGQ